jgi:tRNA (guanine-N7-)-methyltransferase
MTVAGRADHVKVASMTAPYLSLKPLVPWRQLTRPIHWEQIFGRGAPLELEIGCGNGEVLARRAGERPEVNLVGLDLDWVSARRALRRINLAGLDNAKVVQAEAALGLERLFAPQSLAGVWCLFPRPWPKPSDARHRLFSTRFLRLLNSRLAPAAACRLLTDHEPFADWVLGQVRGSGLTAVRREVPPTVDSKYERKWRGQGQRVFFELILSQRGHVAWPNPEEPVLHYPHFDDLDPAGLTTWEDWGEISVLCKDVLRDQEAGRALMRLVVLEDDLEQAFYLEVLPRPQGGYLVRPAPGCGVLPSLGVQRALEVTAQRLSAG